MAIVVAPYNAWREELAGNLLGKIGMQLLERQQAADANRKVAAFWKEVGGVQGGEDNAHTDNPRWRDEVARYNADKDAYMAGQNVAMSAAQAGAMGQAPMQMPAPAQVPVPAGARGTFNALFGGGVSPVPVPQSGNVPLPTENLYRYNPANPGNTHLSLTPQGVLGQGAPRTSTYDFQKAVALLSDPRFAAHSTYILPQMRAMQELIGLRQGQNVIDRENLTKSIVGTLQAAAGTQGAQNIGQLLAAIGSPLSKPSTDIVADQSNMRNADAENFRSEVINRGSELDAVAKIIASNINARGLVNAAINRPTWNAEITQKDINNAILAEQRSLRNLPENASKPEAELSEMAKKNVYAIYGLPYSPPAWMNSQSNSGTDRKSGGIGGFFNSVIPSYIPEFFKRSTPTDEMEFGY